MPKTMTLSAFAKRHGVARKTATRWRHAGYVIPSTGPVDVAASEKLLAERPANSKGGRARGPTAESSAQLAAHISEYEGFRNAHQRAVEVYDRIMGDLRALPAGSAESAVHAIHFKYQDALCTAVQATK